MLFLFMSKPDFGCNPYALWKYIVENTEHQTAWLVKSPTNCEMLRERGIRCDRYNTREGNALVTQADYVIGNVYAFPAVPKREGQIFVNLWHGSGVKAHDYYDPQLAPQQVAHLQKFCEETDLMCVHSLDDRFRLSAMRKRQIGVNLHPHGKLGKRGCRDGRRTDMSKLWKRIYSNVPHHAAEILQQ